MTSADDAVFASLSRLSEKLERAKAELDQSEITRQLQARDLVHRTDEAREYRLERDEAEAKAEDAAEQLSEAQDHIQDLESALAALKAAGYAVVELPKPAAEVDEGYLAHFFAPANGNAVRLRWSKDIVVDGNWYRPDEARDVAAALLAAVEAAEAS